MYKVFELLRFQYLSALKFIMHSWRQAFDMILSQVFISKTKNNSEENVLLKVLLIILLKPVTANEYDKSILSFENLLRSSAKKITLFVAARFVNLSSLFYSFLHALLLAPQIQRCPYN